MKKKIFVGSGILVLIGLIAVSFPTLYGIAALSVKLSVKKMADQRDRLELATYNTFVAPEIPADYYVETVEGQCLHVEFMVPHGADVPTFKVQQRVTLTGGAGVTHSPCSVYRDDGKLIVSGQMENDEVIQPAMFRTGN